MAANKITIVDPSSNQAIEDPIRSSKGQPSSIDVVIGRRVGIQTTKPPSVKVQLSTAEVRKVSHVTYEIEPVQIDFKIPDEALEETSARVGPLTYAPPREGRAIFTVSRKEDVEGPVLEGQARPQTTVVETFDKIYVTNLRLSDTEAFQLHDTFSGPFLNTFDRRPRTLSLSIALPNTKLVTTITEIENVKELEGKSSAEIQQFVEDRTGDWRNDFRRFYETAARASIADSVSVKIQNTIYSGHILSFTDSIAGESDALSMAGVEMVIFDIIYPRDEALQIKEIFKFVEPELTENKGKKFIRLGLEKSERFGGILTLDRGEKKTNDLEEAIIEGVKVNAES